MKTVTQKVFGFLYKTCLANPGGIPSPTTIQRAFAVGTLTEDLTAATFEPDKEQQPEGFLIIPLTSGDIKVHLAGAPAFEDYTISGVEVDASLGVPMLYLVAMASAEYKDREHGGAFDWYDILAGMTLPVLFWVGSLIVLIVK